MNSLSGELNNRLDVLYIAVIHCLFYHFVKLVVYLVYINLLNKEMEAFLASISL